MALKDRKRKKRLIRGGIIRLGHKETKKRADGSEYTYPVQDDHFQLHDAPAILESYGPDQDGKVREIDVTLAFSDVERNFDANYTVWAGGILICKGDGEYVQHASPFAVKDKFDKAGIKTGVSIHNAPGETLVDNGVAQVEFSWNGEGFAPGSLVPCSGESQDLYPHCAACKMTAILKVMMIREELVRMAYYQLATGSGRNYDVIMGTLGELYDNFGQVNGIRYWLRLVEQGTSYKDKSGTRRKGSKWFLQLEPYPEDVQRMYDKQRAKLFSVAQITPPMAQDDFEVEPAAPPPWAEDGQPATDDTDIDTVTGKIIDGEIEPEPKAKSPTDAFSSQSEAIKWGMDQGAFDHAAHAANAYAKCKETHNPRTAAKMGKFWRADVAYRMLIKAAQKYPYSPDKFLGDCDLGQLRDLLSKCDEKKDPASTERATHLVVLIDHMAKKAPD